MIKEIRDIMHRMNNDYTKRGAHMRRLKSQNEIKKKKKTFTSVLISIAVIISLGILSYIIYMINKISYKEMLLSFSIFFAFILIEYFIIIKILKKIK